MRLTAALDLTGGQFARLEAHPNAGSLDMDLSGSIVPEFDVQLNAGSLSLQTDGETALTGLIGVNAGSVDLCTAPEAGLRITVNSNVTFSHNLDEAGLQQNGDTYSTANFASSERAVVLDVEGNAASFTLNPEEGCA